ncbi:unnamed protein product [Camellia sinensis]
MIGQQAVHTFLGAGAQQLNRDCLYERFSQKNLSFPTVALNLMLYVKARKDIIRGHDFHKGDLPGVCSQQADPSQWSSTYYGYGQGYDAYGYGTTHDPSLYAYGAYPGCAQYPQQAGCEGSMIKVSALVEGSQEMASMSGAVPAVEQREEYDPLATPDVDNVECCLPCRPWKCHFGPAHVAENLITLTASIGSYGSTYFICQSLIGFWCANVTERKTIISKITAVPKGNPVNKNIGKQITSMA